MDIPCVCLKETWPQEEVCPTHQEKRWDKRGQIYGYIKELKNK